MARDVDASNLMPVSRERSPYGELEQIDLRKRIREALAELPPTLREAVVLRDLQEFSYQEIADKLRLPEGTVKSRINRGRLELARQIRRLQSMGPAGKPSTPGGTE
jgi:RNA polymerase sigma-70 factor (ECF subfamily)